MGDEGAERAKPQGLFRNTLSYTLVMVAGYGFSLLLAPLMLSRLGLAQFGVWALSGGLAIYFGLADLGVRRSLSRFVALFESRGDQRAVAESFTLALLAAALVSLLSALGAWLAAPLFARELGVLDEPAMRQVMLAAAVIFAGETFAGVLDAVPVGHRRMVAPNVAQLVSHVLNFGFSAGALLASTDLVDYAYANAAAAVLGVGVSAVAMLTVWRPRLAWPGRALMREVLGYGVKTQLGLLADLVNNVTDKLVLGLVVGARAAAAYEIAARVVAAVRALAVTTVWAMIPTATAEIATRGRSIVGDFFRRYTRVTVALAFPVFLGACVTAPFLLMAWLDQLPDESVGVVLILSAAYFVNIATGVADALVAADGRPGLSTRYMVLAAGLNVVLTLGAAPLLGFYGVVAATGVAIATGSALFLAHFLRTYGLSRHDLARAVGPPALLALGVAVPVALIAASWPSAEDRWAALTPLAVCGGLYAAGYWIAAGRLGFLPARLSPRRFWRARSRVTP